MQLLGVIQVRAGQPWPLHDLHEVVCVHRLRPDVLEVWYLWLPEAAGEWPAAGPVG